MPNKNFNPDGIDYMLFTPGPANVPDWILKEMGKANDTHRSTSYRQMHAALREGLQKLLHTKNDILFYASSGSGIMEACVRNLLSDDDLGLFFTCGEFGDRWFKIALENGKKADQVSVPLGKAVTPQLVKEMINKKKYAVVFITMNETATGVMNPIEKLAPIVKETGALLCIDCVSCMAGVNIDVDAWKLDVALASVQKCFGLPPGLAVCSVSDAAFAKAEKVKNRGSYLDFIAHKKYGEKNEHPCTPPVPQMRALKASLERILKDGPEAQYKRHEELTQLIQEWAVKQGFKIFSEEGYHSKTVVTVSNNLNIDVEKFVNDLFDKGFKIVNGYGELKGKTFRMAPMGWITRADTEKMLKAATEALQIQLKK